MTAETITVSGVTDYSGNEIDFESSSVDIETLLVTPHLVGDFNSWDPANHDYDFTLNEYGLWELTIDFSEGEYEYKVIESDAWNENDWPGVNQLVSLESSEEVTFLANCGFYTGVRNWDEFVTHLEPVIAGNFLDTLGMGNNWDPLNIAGIMNDDDGDGIFTWEALILEGDWEYKVALNQNWDQDTYGNGGNFSISSDGSSTTTFHYDFRENSTYYTVDDSCDAGDLNTDGGIDVLDVVGVVNIILGNTVPSNMELCAADYNGDGTVDVLDIVGIVSTILGN